MAYTDEEILKAKKAGSRRNKNNMNRKNWKRKRRRASLTAACIFMGEGRLFHGV